MRNLSIRWRYEIIIAEALATALVTLFTGIAVSARDLGQWDAPNNTELKRWYQDLKQPDNPQRRVAVKQTLIGLMPLRQHRMQNMWLLSPIRVTTSR
jgi:hypothetical protein